jgi:hypothetical protein
MSNLIKIRSLEAEMFRVGRRTDGWTDITKVNSRFLQFYECTQILLILPALRTTNFNPYIYPQQNNQLIFETRLRCITAFI